MALVPRSNWYRDWWNEIDRYHRDIERHFERLTLYNDNVWRMPPFPSFRSFFRPWRSMLDDLDRDVAGMTTVEQNDDRYRVIVDVHQFAPEEVTVRTDDKYITIEAKHKDKPDRRGYVSREFMRRYLLPRGYDIDRLQPNLSSDGILTITAPKLALPAPGERILPIKRSFFPAIRGRDKY
ncbi:PREDICTED: protein lethal(2)essential for life-like [Dinoponera quadriceps]|uniref:Protein lethal(2)essential for life-like n=1 Tax=Dinoponera quadriceps TaxID=609295 RepID=A0A6P3XR17_DINQU|nr:PREDICTED: protein lethal(2)essential for life-like [Dinoponera quadriceps]XP_014480955.1 PREDICTED: protein lethal(2)essential for life-like [Dinoponera quadriceps]XP_014480956.1 PREDICTED: protein lethal(2)essential for life-like [Dinoponera quadriceps]